MYLRGEALWSLSSGSTHPSPYLADFLPLLLHNGPDLCYLLASGQAVSCLCFLTEMGGEVR